ncbi:hypothetical protein VP01_1388g4 [Puccinia sorghi]|uniref:Uncharacterized protein n=1 Tax=Puccinia sorghi TaxID=27349 RepID=A0A0L6VL80_9BASI|nr:hypothetical protein VP01_1388g4 [Puccinia sorghi]
MIAFNVSAIDNTTTPVTNTNRTPLKIVTISQVEPLFTNKEYRNSKEEEEEDLINYTDPTSPDHSQILAFPAEKATKPASTFKTPAGLKEQVKQLHFTWIKRVTKEANQSMEIEKHPPLSEATLSPQLTNKTQIQEPNNKQDQIAIKNNQKNLQKLMGNDKIEKYVEGWNPWVSKQALFTQTKPKPRNKKRQASLAGAQTD